MEIDVPAQIETERFIIRRPREEDLAAYFAAWFDSFDQIKPWFGPWAKEQPTIEKVAASIKEAIAEWDEKKTLTYLCFEKESGKLVGRTFFSRLEWGVPKGMMGYWVRNGHHGDGVGSQMVQALANMAFEQLGFKRLELYIDPRNQPGVKFAEKNGFLYEGRLRNYSYDNFGTMRDYLVYSMTPFDFQCAVRPSNVKVSRDTGLCALVV